MNFYIISTILQITLLYSIIAIAVTFSFRIIGFPDLTPDGSFVVGASITGTMAINGTSPILGLVVGTLAGALAGIVAASLHVKLGISKLLSGILVMLALYSISLRIMGTSNVSLLNVDSFIGEIAMQTGIMPVLIALCLCSAVLFVAYLLLRTRTGILLRATGDSETALEYRGQQRGICYVVGLAFSNALCALGGGIIGLYQGFVDISMGTGLVVTCLAAIILGETIIRPEKVFSLIISPILGMLLYQTLIAITLRAGLTPADLKISTAILATVFIIIDRLRVRREAFGKQIGNRSF